MQDDYSTKLTELQSVLTRMLKDLDSVCNKHNITYWLDCGTLLGAARHKGFIPWDDDIDVVMPREDYERFKEIAPEILPKNFYYQNKEIDTKYRYYWTKLRDRNSIAMETWEKDNEGKYHMGISMDIFPMDYVNNYKSYLFFKNWFVCRFKNKIFNFIMRIFRTLIVFVFRKKNIIKFANNHYSKNKSGKYLAKGFDCPFRWYFKTEDVFPLKKLDFDGTKLWVPGNYHNYLTFLYGDYSKLPTEEQKISEWHYMKFDTKSPCKFELNLRKNEK